MSGWAWALEGSPTGDYCLDDSIRLLQMHAGAEARVLRVFRDKGGGVANGTGAMYWLWTNACSGQIVTYIWTKMDECDTPYLGGDRSTYVAPARTWGTGDCEALGARMQAGFRRRANF